MSTAPVPASLVFLSDLDNYPTEAKVRFLGCVASYNDKTGSAVLTHHYPSTARHQIIASVNVDLVLESLDACVLQVGSWVNVVGYISGRKLNPTIVVVQSVGDDVVSVVGDVPVYSEVSVRAVMLWSAGDLKLSSYEARLQERKDLGLAG